MCNNITNYGKWLLCLWVIISSTLSCTTNTPPQRNDDDDLSRKDSLETPINHHSILGINLEAIADSVSLSCLPLKDCTYTIYKGDHVVVAEIMRDTTSVTDTVWIKLAHSQEIQGWIHEADMKKMLVPVDSISQTIHFFNDKNVVYGILTITVFIAALLIRAYRKDHFKIILFNDIDSDYPCFLCLTVAVSATIYESIQTFIPEKWEVFYYNPTLMPMSDPVLIGMFLASIWIMFVALLAAIAETFRLLPLFDAVFYLLGLFAFCFLSYFFFIYATRFYIGYPTLLALIFLFMKRTIAYASNYPYRCGKCGGRLKAKGVCPKCGAINE